MPNPVQLSFDVGGLGAGTYETTVTRSSAAAALMGLVLVAFLAAFPNADALLLGLAGIALGAAVYFGAAWALGVEEVRDFVRRIGRRIPTRIKESFAPDA